MMIGSWRIVLDSSWLLNSNSNLNADSLYANAYMFLVFVLLLGRELISKYKNDSSVFEPFSSSYWYEELKNKNKNATFDFWFLVSLLERPL